MNNSTDPIGEVARLEAICRLIERRSPDGDDRVLFDANVADDLARDIRTVLKALDPSLRAGSPIPMILHCPTCHVQHIDGPEDERFIDWDNPPHRSHLCHHCGCIWRPADVATEGVEFIKTVGKADRPGCLRAGSNEVARALAVLENFEVKPADADGDVWLWLHGNGTSGKGGVNLGAASRVVVQVARDLDDDRKAAIAALRTVQQPPVGEDSGYVAAFYEIGKMLGLPAMTCSPKEAFEQHIKPAIRKLVAPVGEDSVERGAFALVDGFSCEYDDSCKGDETFTIRWADSHYLVAFTSGKLIYRGSEDENARVVETLPPVGEQSRPVDVERVARAIHDSLDLSDSLKMDLAMEGEWSRAAEAALAAMSTKGEK